MEDLRPLTLVCKHLRNESHDETIARLGKQKHAAHAATHRLRKKVRELQLAVQILSAVWIHTERQNETLRQQFRDFVENALENQIAAWKNGQAIFCVCSGAGRQLLVCWMVC